MDNAEASGREVAIDTSAVSLITRGEIDMQIATAHKYPRSIKRFRDEALQMVTLDESIASECLYVLPRKQYDKETGRYQVVNIEGPSARFAEVIASAWGNCRAGARIVQEANGFIVAQGIFHDLERNSAIAYEVQRSIMNSKGERFKADMIGVTGNAASSIALRNAILKGVPKAFWSALYGAARQCAMGDFKTLANRRSDALKEFQNFGISAPRVFAKLGVSGVEDVTLEHLLTLRGLLTAIRDGDTTPEQAFADEGETKAAPVVPRKAAEAKPAPAPEAPPPEDKPASEEQAPGEVRYGPGTDETIQSAEAAPESRPDDPPAEPDTGELATDGERTHLKMRATAKKLRLGDAMTAAGVDRDAGTLDGLTKAEFKRIKAQL